MQIDAIDQVHIRMRLKHPFQTSFGTQTDVDKILIAVRSDGVTGWGESPTSSTPGYSYETVHTAWHIQRDYLIPLLLASTITGADDVGRVLRPVRGHPMAKAAIEAAVRDAQAQQAGTSVAAMLGATRDRVPVGVSVGVQPTEDALIERVERFLGEGYARIKVKIKPGWDVAPIARLREAFPEATFMADANSAYTLADRRIFTILDAYDLLMIEQPLAHNDLIDHADLQRELATPLCLDESITSVGRLREAVAMGSGRVINLKPGRVGGWAESVRIHDVCVDHNLDLWVGGMLESGVGRAHNLALAALPGVTLPGDISATARYWHEDIVDHDFTLNPGGTMSLPKGPGIGVQVVPAALERVTVRRETYRPA